MIKENHYKKLVDMFSLSIDPKIGEGKIEGEIKFYPNVIGLQRFVDRSFKFFTEDVEKTERMHNIFIHLFNTRHESKKSTLILRNSIKTIKKIKGHSDDMQDLCKFFSELDNFINGKQTSIKQRQISNFLKDIKYKQS